MSQVSPAILPLPCPILPAAEQSVDGRRRGALELLETARQALFAAAVRLGSSRTAPDVIDVWLKVEVVRDQALADIGLTSAQWQAIWLADEMAKRVRHAGT